MEFSNSYSQNPASQQHSIPGANHRSTKMAMTPSVMSLEHFKAVLSDALQSKDTMEKIELGLKSQFESLSADSKQPDTTCYLLETIPVEIRKQIYSLLLVNRTLATPDCLTRSCDGNDVALYLHPAIMRTCHQVYDEASQVLYGENKF